MKRFEFSLNKLLSYKQQVLKREKNDLANLRRHQQILIEEKQALKEKLIMKNTELCQRINGGISCQLIALHKNYMTSLNEQTQGLTLKIHQVGLNIEKQLGIVVEVTKEINSLEKLEGKQLSEYSKAEQKVNELFIEEFVQYTSSQKAR